MLQIEDERQHLYNKNAFCQSYVIYIQIYLWQLMVWWGFFPGRERVKKEQLHNQCHLAREHAIWSVYNLSKTSLSFETYGWSLNFSPSPLLSITSTDSGIICSYCTLHWQDFNIKCAVCAIFNSTLSISLLQYLTQDKLYR